MHIRRVYFSQDYVITRPLQQPAYYSNVHVRHEYNARLALQRQMTTCLSQRLIELQNSF